MDGLMSEAADVILSSSRNAIKEPNRALECKSRRHSIGIVQDASSVTLLRLSITKSIRNRRTLSEVVDIETSNENKSRRRKGPLSRKPKVDIKLLNSEEDSLSVNVSTIDDKNTHKNNDIRGENKLRDSVDAFTDTLNYKEKLSSKKIDGFESANHDSGHHQRDKDKITATNNEGETTRKKLAENGLKLARRKFSDGIFENCSTYSLACPDVLHEMDGAMLKERDSPDAVDGQLPNDASTKVAAHKLPMMNSELRQSTSDVKRHASVESGNSADEQISLSDSFFGNVISGDNTRQNSFPSKESEHSSKENDLLTSRDTMSTSCERHLQKSERKLSKKLRKRQKKNKPKNVSTYDCPKCGVSYVLSSKSSDSTARCLHCDFWKSVEPVFLKAEKQPWNSCRIC